MPVRAAFANASTSGAKIGPGIGEQIFDAALGEDGEIGLRHIIDREFFPGHWITSSKKHQLPQFCAFA